MAREQDMQAIADALAASQQQQNLWFTPTVSPTQSPDLVSGGLTASPQPIVAQPAMPPLMSPFSYGLDQGMLQQQMAAQMQMRDSLQTQQLFQNQMALSNFARGIPGALPPSAYMADPTMAQYQLQSMNFMNPFMAQHFASRQGLAGGRGGVDLPPAYYNTPSRMGIFRPDFGRGQPEVEGGPGIFRSLVTLGKVPFVHRTYASYEDPIDARIEASRELTRTKQSFMETGSTLALSAAGFLAPTPFSLPLQAAAIGKGIIDIGGQQRQAEAEMVRKLSEQISSNARSEGFRGRGFSLTQSANVVKEFRGAAANDPFHNITDYMDVFKEGVNNNLLSFNSTSGNTISKVKEIVGSIDVFMKLMGDPDVKSAMDRMGKLQTMGVSVNKMQDAAVTMKTYARLAGTSVDEMMSTTGAFGAQMAAQTGMLPGAGMAIAGMAQAQVTGAVQTGAVNEKTLAALGGVQGATQSAAQIVMSEVQSHMGGGSVLAFARTDAQGRPLFDAQGAIQFDEQKLKDYVATGKIPGGADSLKAAGLEMFHAAPDHETKMKLMFALPEMELAFDAQVADTPDMAVKVFQRRQEELAGKTGMSVTQQLKARYRHDAATLSYMMSPEGMAAVEKSRRETQRTVDATQDEKDRRSNDWTSRGIRAAAGFWDSLVNGAGWENRTAEEQAAAAIDSATSALDQTMQTVNTDLPSATQNLLNQVRNSGQYFSPTGSRNIGVVSDYGQRNLKGEQYKAASKEHRGIDLAAAGQIYAAQSGTLEIQNAGRSDESIGVRSDDGTYLGVMHSTGTDEMMERYRRGERAIRAGDVIGRSLTKAEMKERGSEFESHMHFEAQVGNEYVDPLPYLVQAGANIKGKLKGARYGMSGLVEDTTKAARHADVARENSQSEFIERISANKDVIDAAGKFAPAGLMNLGGLRNDVAGGVSTILANEGGYRDVMRVLNDGGERGSRFARDKAAALQGLESVSKSNGGIDFEKFNALPIADRAALVKSVMTSGTDQAFSTFRGSFGDLHKVLNAAQSARGSQFLDEAAGRLVQHSKALGINSDKEQVGLAHMIANVADVPGASKIGTQKLAELTAALTEQGWGGGLTQASATKLFRQFGITESEASADNIAKFVDTQKGLIADFSNVADSKTKSAISQYSREDLGGYFQSLLETAKEKKYLQERGEDALLPSPAQGQRGLDEFKANTRADAGEFGTENLAEQVKKSAARVAAASQAQAEELVNRSDTSHMTAEQKRAATARVTNSLANQSMSGAPATDRHTASLSSESRKVADNTTEMVNLLQKLVKQGGIA